MQVETLEDLKERLRGLSFNDRVLEPESMEETVEDYAAMDFTATSRAFVELLSPLIPFDSLVADAGCGPGEIARMLARTRPDLTVVGLDIAPAMIWYAMRQHWLEGSDARITWVVGDMTELPFRWGRIDFLYSHTAVHHLTAEGIQWFLREMWTVLAPGGGFCIRDLRRPEDAEEAMVWIQEATGDPLTPRQYELFFHSLRASLTIEELERLARNILVGTIEVVPPRYWVFRD